MSDEQNQVQSVSAEEAKRLLEPEGELAASRGSAIIRKCEAEGWKDVHGGPEEGGMFWRGINLETGRVEAIPQEIFEQND